MADRTLTHAASLVPVGAHAGKPAMPLTRGVVSIGAGKHNRIQLKSDTVSTTHALLVHTEAGWYVRDLGSRTHTILNGKVAKEATLKSGDTITIGAFTFHFVSDDRGEEAHPTPAALEVTDAEIPLPIDTRTVAIGRRMGCEIRLVEESVSLVHAILFEIDGTHYVRDLYSRTGTFLNGRKVHQEPLAFGDVIVCGDTTLKYVPDTSVEVAPEAIEESLAPAPAEPDLAPLPVAEEDDAIPLSPAARDTIDLNAVDHPPGDDEADAPVVPLGRRREIAALPIEEIEPATEVPAPTMDALGDASVAISTGDRRRADGDEPAIPESTAADAEADVLALTPADEASDESDEAVEAIAPEVPAHTTDDDEAAVLGLVPESAAASEVSPAAEVELAAERTSAEDEADVLGLVSERAETSEVSSVAEVEVAERSPDEDEADVLGLAPEPSKAAAATPAPAAVRPPDVIAQPAAVAEVPPAPPADTVAAATPEPVDEFADDAEAPAPVAEAGAAALETAALHSPLEPTAIPPSPVVAEAETPAEAAQLARLEQQVRTALQDPSTVSRLPSLLSGEANAAAQRLGEATRRAKLIAEMLETTEVIEAEAEKQTIEFADVPADAASGAVDAGAGALVASPDESSAAIEPLEFGPIPDDVLPVPDVFVEARPLPPIAEAEVPALELGEATVEAGVPQPSEDGPIGLEVPIAMEEPIARDALDDLDAAGEMPIEPTLRVADEVLAPASLPVEAVPAAEVELEIAAPVRMPEPIAGADEDETIELAPPVTIADAVPAPAIEPAAAVAAEVVTPTTLADLTAATPAASLPISEEVAEPADLPVTTDERPVEVADFRAPIEADAVRAGDVIATAPVVATGPTELEEAEAKGAELLAVDEAARAEKGDAKLKSDVGPTSDIEPTDEAEPISTVAVPGDDVDHPGEVAVDQAALDAAAERIDAPMAEAAAGLTADIAEPSGEIIEALITPPPAVAEVEAASAAEPVEPAPAVELLTVAEDAPRIELARSGELVDAATMDGPLDLPTPHDEEIRPLVAADEHLDAGPTVEVLPDLASLEPPPLAATAAAPTIEADALTATVAASAAPVESDSGTLPADATIETVVPSDSDPAILAGPADDDRAILAAAGLAPIEAGPAVVADAGGNVDLGEDEPAARPVEFIAPAAEAAGPAMPFVNVPKPATTAQILDDAFADALAMAEGRSFAPPTLPPPARPVDPKAAEAWKLDESLLDQQASHGDRPGAVDPLAPGLAPHVEGFLNLGGIGYIGDESDEYEPVNGAAPTPAKKGRKPRTRRPTADKAAPAPTEAAAEAPAAGVTPAAEAPTVRPATPPAITTPPAVTPPRPRRKPPVRKGQAAVEQSFASAQPTAHSPFAEQALPLVDAFSGQTLDGSTGNNGAAGLDSVLARLNGDSGTSPGQVLDQPPIVPDAPPTTAASDLAEEPRAPRVRPAVPTPTPFASYMPIAQPDGTVTPPRPRRVAKRPANRLPGLLLLATLCATAAGLAASYAPVSRTVQGTVAIENLDSQNTIERTKTQDALLNTLAQLAGAARAKVDDRYGDGFLDRPEAFHKVVSTAQFLPPDPDPKNRRPEYRLALRVASDVKGVEADRKRLGALLEAFVESQQGAVAAQAGLRQQLREIEDKQAKAVAARDELLRQIELTRPLGESFSSDTTAMRELDADLAKLDAARQLARQTLAAREAELKRLEADAAALNIRLPEAAVAVASIDDEATLGAVLNGAIVLAPRRPTTAPAGLVANGALFANGMPTLSILDRLNVPVGVALTALTAPLTLDASAPVIGGAIDAGTPKPAGPTAATPASTQPVVAATPADLAKLSADRDAAKADLDRLMQSQSPEARKARESFDNALGAFATEVESAGKSLGDKPEVLAYVQSARALQDQIRRMTDTLVRRQEQQVTRLGEFKRRLSELTDSSRDQRYAGDDQLKTWNDRLAIAQRRLNAAKDAGATPQELDDIQREITMAESSIAGRKQILDDPRATQLTRELGTMIQTTQREMEQDREDNEKVLSGVQEAFQRQQPAVEKLPDDQKQLAQNLAARLAQIDLARQRYTRSLGVLANGSDQVALAQARERFATLDEQVTQLRARLDASAAAQSAEMERRGRVAKALDEARTAVVSARAARDAAEAAYAERAAARDALAKQLDQSRAASEKLEDLKAQSEKLRTEIDQRRLALNGVTQQLKFAVVPKGIEEPQEVGPGRLDPRLALGAAGVGAIGCIFAPFIAGEVRRRRLLGAARPAGPAATPPSDDGTHTGFPPHASIA